MLRILLFVMCTGVFSIAEGYAMKEKTNEKISVKKERKPLQLLDSKKNNKLIVIKKEKEKKNEVFSNENDKENLNSNVKQKSKTKNSPIKKT